MKNNYIFFRQSFPGFTLFEVLIALFIFSLLSTIVTFALRSVINTETRAEATANKIRELQFALLILSRDVEQAVNRPITNYLGKEEPPFLGTPTYFMLSHTGFANFNATQARSALSRTGYTWDEEGLWRLSWEALDQTPKSQPHRRKILSNVSSLHFQYLNMKGKFVDRWPSSEDAGQPLPRAVKVNFVFSKWGELSQLYLIPIELSKNDPSKDEQDD